MEKIKALILTGYGINCEEEMAAAYMLAGADAQIVHLSDVFADRISIHDYQVLNFPGGFSFGDDLGSAKVLGNKFKFKPMASDKRFMEELQKFLSDGKYIMGVCNGFQALVKMGLLPNVSGNFEQEATLTHNDSGKFEDRWVRMKVNPNARVQFLNGLHEFDVPVRHGEGKLIFRDDTIRKKVVEQNLNVLDYTDKNGNSTAEYPLNPNGSELNCAGLTDPSRQVFGLMPHPEAYLSLYNHPNWGQKKRQNPDISENGEGLKLFKNIVNKIK